MLHDIFKPLTKLFGVAPGAYIVRGRNKVSGHRRNERLLGSYTK